MLNTLTSLVLWVNLHTFVVVCDFFSKLNLLKKNFRNNIIKTKNKHSVGPDMGRNYLHKLSAGDKSRAAKYIDFSFSLLAGSFCILMWFSRLTFSKSSFRNTIRESNNLDPDQDRRFVGPDLGPNCLHKLYADD